MTRHARTICCSLLGACLLSCAPEEHAAKASCSAVGERLHEQALHGIIYGSVGAKAAVSVCGNLELPFAFIAGEPEAYKNLKSLAEQREDVVGFNAVGDGYLVTDGPGRYLLLLISLDDVREDPNVAKRARAATG